MLKLASTIINLVYSSLYSGYYVCMLCGGRAGIFNSCACAPLLIFAHIRGLAKLAHIRRYLWRAGERKEARRVFANKTKLIKFLAIFAAIDALVGDTNT